LDKQCATPNTKHCGSCKRRGPATAAGAVGSEKGWADGDWVRDGERSGGGDRKRSQVGEGESCGTDGGGGE